MEEFKWVDALRIHSYMEGELWFWVPCGDPRTTQKHVRFAGGVVVGLWADRRAICLLRAGHLFAGRLLWIGGD